MDRYTKAFVGASLVWFATAAGIGVWMAGMGAPDGADFAHVHFNLLGFMAMMVYGVGYFIVPRFNARTLRWPSWVPLHFWLANIGLVGMVLTYPERPSAGFTLFCALSGIGAAMFALNLGITVLGPAPAAAETLEPTNTQPAGNATASGAPAVPAAPAVVITGDMRVGELLTRWPETAEILVQAGLAPLANPAHREKVKNLPVTLEMACGNHDLDLEEVLRRLNAAVGGGIGAAQPAVRAIGPDDVIGDVLRVHPSTEPVFRKYYGAACFSCPGQATETVRQSAMMHNAREEELLRELNAAAGLR